MNDTLKVLLGVFIGLTVLSGGILLYQNMPAEEQGLGGGRYNVDPEYLGGPTNYATTTKTFVEVGAATTTMAFDCDGAELLDMNIMLAASSTATNLIWNYQFSYDNIDWFYEDGKTIDSISAVTHNAGAVTHSWTPGTTTETTKNVTITPVASKYCKVNFENLGANGNLWVVILKQLAF